MKRFLALCLSVIFLLGVLVGFFPTSPASAATAYDNAVQLDTEVTIISPDGTESADLSPLSPTSYVTLLSESVATECPASYAEFSSAVSGNGVWGLSSYISTVDGDKRLYLYWDVGGTMVFGIHNSTTYNAVQLVAPNITTSTPATDGGSVTYRINDSGVISLQCSETSYGLTNNRISRSSGGNVAKIIFTTAPINYPSGYEGSFPPTEVFNPVVYYPQVGYSLYDDLRITALSLAPNNFCIPVGLTETTGCATNYQLRYTLYDSLDAIIDQQTLPQYEVYAYQFPGEDDYTFTVEYIAPPPPFLPLSPDADFKPVVFPLDVDGFFQSGGTGLETCVDTGSSVDCDGSTPLTDCSVFTGVFPYGFLGEGTPADIVGAMNCNLTNLGIQIQAWLKDLFMPRYGFFNDWSTNFGDFLNSKLGFVATSFAFVGSLFSEIIDNGASTSCTIEPDGEIFGATFSVNVCSFATIIGSTPWAFMQGTVISLTVLALIFAGYRKYLEVVSHR